MSKENEGALISQRNKICHYLGEGVFRLRNVNIVGFYYLTALHVSVIDHLQVKIYLLGLTPLTTDLRFLLFI
jgi:hypothetical protein